MNIQPDDILKQNVVRVIEGAKQAAIQSGRSPDDISVLAATKTVDAQTINKSLDFGIKLIGENRVQELLDKYSGLNLNKTDLHFIGHLQTNKVKYIADKVSMIHSVDSLSLAKEIDKQAKKHDRVIKCLVEINIGGELSKSGIEPNETAEILKSMSELSNIKVSGLMTIPPITLDIVKTRDFFKKMHNIFVDIKAKTLDNIFMDYLSMGMSADYYEAILEGSNLIRVGSAIYGARK